VTDHRLEVLPSADAAAARFAELLAERARSTVREQGRFAGVVVTFRDLSERQLRDRQCDHRKGQQPPRLTVSRPLP